MGTLGDLVDQVDGYLHSWTQSTPRYATIVTADMGIDTYSINLSVDAEQSRGVVEVGNELIYIESVSQSDFSGAIPAWGRGYHGSPVEEHVIGDRVTIDPLVPRHVIKTTIQQLCSSVYPDIYQVGVDTTQTWSANVNTLPLPDACDQLLDVSYYEATYGTWNPIGRWRIDNAADESVNPSGKTVMFANAAPDGATIKFVYQQRLGIPQDNTDDLEEATGIGAGIDDVLLWGSLARLVMGPEFASKQIRFAEQADRQRYVTQGSGTALSRYCMGLYADALDRARRRMFERYPTRVQRTW